jgi:hypothetical protein
MNDADSPRTELRKDMDLLAWLHENGHVDVAERDMRKEKLLSGCFDRDQRPPPSSAKLAAPETQRERKTRGKRRKVAVLSESDSDSSDSAPESKSASLSAERSAGKQRRKSKAKPTPTKSSSLRDKAIDAAMRSDTLTKFENASCAKTKVYIQSGQEMFPRQLGNTFINKEGNSQEVWIEEAGIWKCSVCPGGRNGSKFDPSKDRFDSKMGHNIFRKHTNNLLEAAQMVEGETAVLWPADCVKYSDCLPSHEELDLGKVMIYSRSAD